MPSCLPWHSANSLAMHRHRLAGADGWHRANSSPPQAGAPAHARPREPMSSTPTASPRGPQAQCHADSRVIGNYDKPPHRGSYVASPCGRCRHRAVGCRSSRTHIPRRFVPAWPSGAGPKARGMPEGTCTGACYNHFVSYPQNYIFFLD